MDINDLLTFRKMITPVIVQAVFWIGAGIAVIAGLIGIGSGLSSSYGGGTQVLLGLLILVLGPVVVRIYCELLILLFKMYEALNEVRTSLMELRTQNRQATGVGSGQ